MDLHLVRLLPFEENMAQIWLQMTDCRESFDPSFLWKPVALTPIVSPQTSLVWNLQWFRTLVWLSTMGPSPTRSGFCPKGSMPLGIPNHHISHDFFPFLAMLDYVCMLISTICSLNKGPQQASIKWPQASLIFALRGHALYKLRTNQLDWACHVIVLFFCRLLLSLPLQITCRECTASSILSSIHRHALLSISYSQDFTKLVCTPSDFAKSRTKVLISFVRLLHDLNAE